MLALIPVFLASAAVLQNAAARPHHVVISVPTAEDARKLQRIFTHDLGLPALWPVAKYGIRTSGGVYLGNFALELAVWPQVDAYQLLGLAVAADNPQALTARGLTLREQEPVQGQMEYWRNTAVTQLAGEGLGIFLCRYNPAWMTSLEEKAKAAFHGGPAGVSGVASIEVSVNPPRREALAKLFEPEKLDSLSPAIIFIEGRRFQIHSVTVRCKDPERAKAALPEGFPVVFTR